MAKKKIRTVVTERVDMLLPGLDAEEVIEKRYRISYEEYDVTGNLVREEQFGTDGVPEGVTEYAYDEKGLMILEMQHSAEDEITEEREYRRDGSGRITGEVRRFLDGTVEQVTYRYDGQNRLIEKQAVDEEDEVTELETAVYEGELLVRRERQEYGETVSREEFTYDAEGNLTETKQWNASQPGEVVSQIGPGRRIEKTLRYDDKGRLVGRIIMEHNAEGKMVEMTEETPAGINTTVFGYDENGNGVLQEEKNPEGEVVQRVERTYDDDGNVTESDVFIHLRERGYSRKYRLVYTYTFWPESGE